MSRERCLDAKRLLPGTVRGTETGGRVREGGLFSGKTVTRYVGCSHRVILNYSLLGCDTIFLGECFMRF